MITTLEPSVALAEEQKNRLGLSAVQKIFFNLPPAALIEQSLLNAEGYLADTGALMVDTGVFTGRSPQDRFIVSDDKTVQSVWWSDINIPFDTQKFDALHQKMLDYLVDKKVYVRHGYACAHADYRINITVVNTWAWHNLFCHNILNFCN